MVKFFFFLFARRNKYAEHGFCKKIINAETKRGDTEATVLVELGRAWDVVRNPGYGQTDARDGSSQWNIRRATELQRTEL